MTYTKPTIALREYAVNFVQSVGNKNGSSCRDAGTALSQISSNGAYELDE